MKRLAWMAGLAIAALLLLVVARPAGAQDLGPGVMLQELESLGDAYTQDASPGRADLAPRRARSQTVVCDGSKPQAAGQYQVSKGCPAGVQAGDPGLRAAVPRCECALCPCR
jgi:hypothetical protein